MEEENIDEYCAYRAAFNNKKAHLCEPCPFLNWVDSIL